MNTKNTNIGWITSQRRAEGEWCRYRKRFTLDETPEGAVVRFESDCVCGIFVNGEFLISGTGRYPERVNCHEVTARLHSGGNTIEILTGGHYFQTFGRTTKEKRGYWLNQAALELEITLPGGARQFVATDNTWEKLDTEDPAPILQTMQVTQAEYRTMWKNAAVWKETKTGGSPVRPEVAAVAGDDYTAYAKEPMPEFVYGKALPDTAMKLEQGYFTAGEDAQEADILLDMGRICVGYVEFDYTSTQNLDVELCFDFSERPEDFLPDSPMQGAVRRLAITERLQAGAHSYRNLRRRAFRYLKLTFRGNLRDCRVGLPKVRQCLFPVEEKGWFRCTDEMLNKAWEMGKYTLHVNKHQEYESCPRKEMLFFAGDGEVDALIDIYAFGNCDMLNTSLSLKHEASAIGIATYEKFNRTVWQWDYFAWRIICIYDYYRHTGDRGFLARHYDEAVQNISWMTERMNGRNLLFQIPAFLSTFSSTMVQVDWACSIHRLGENAFLNCLLYKSLACMAELAEAMDAWEQAEGWKALARDVKTAINTHLWDEQKQAYADGLGGCVCQDSNALAVIFGVAEGQRADRVLETMKARLWTPYGSAMAEEVLHDDVLRGGRKTVSPMMSTHEAEAWFRQGRAREGLELIRRVWGTMLKKGATTFWEFSPNNGTEGWDCTCHAWSAGCTYLLSAFILGLRPAAPNWSAVHFAPRPCDLDTGKGVVPTPQGLIAASWQKTAEGWRFRLALPEAALLTTDLPDSSTLEITRY